MTQSSLLTSLEEVKRMLKELNLLKAENCTRPRTLHINKFSEEFISLSQKDDYLKTYRIAMQNVDYDFLLVDDSFFQFSCTLNNGRLEEGTIRYAYYPNPRECLTYEDFLNKFSLTYEECKDDFYGDYEQYVAESKLKNSIIPIRYDYDYNNYSPLKHPISHIHITNESDFRIAVSKILCPQKFVSFIIRTVYYDHWKNYYDNNEVYKNICLAAKEKCTDLDNNYFSEIEKEFLYIT